MKITVFEIVGILWMIAGYIITWILLIHKIIFLALIVLASFKGIALLWFILDGVIKLNKNLEVIRKTRRKPTRENK